MKLYLIIIGALIVIQIKAQTYSGDSIAQFMLNKEYSLWQAETDSARVRLLTEKAYLYRQKEKYTFAIKEIERAVAFVDDSSFISDRWRYEALINYFLANEFEKANLILEKFYIKQARTIYKQKEYFYLRWSVFTETSQFQKCKDEMILLCDSIGGHDTILVNEIKQLAIECKQKDSKKARRMSLLPGAGSVYAGYPLKGTVSFLTDGALIGLTAFLVIDQLYITAFVSGLLPLIKFYSGNIKLAGRLVHNKNLQNDLELKKAYYQQISSVILRIDK